MTDIAWVADLVAAKARIREKRVSGDVETVAALVKAERVARGRFAELRGRVVESVNEYNRAAEQLGMVALNLRTDVPGRLAYQSLEGRNDAEFSLVVDEDKVLCSRATKHLKPDQQDVTKSDGQFDQFLREFLRDA